MIEVYLSTSREFSGDLTLAVGDRKTGEVYEYRADPGGAHRIQLRSPGAYSDLSFWLRHSSSKLFGWKRLGKEDTLGVMILPGPVILGNVLHRKRPSGAPACYVECPDGRKSQSCILCEVEGVKIRICC
jgi:hypothetical protein